MSTLSAPERYPHARDLLPIVCFSLFVVRAGDDVNVGLLGSQIRCRSDVQRELPGLYPAAMATRVIEVLVDDLDGSTEDVDTVRFSIDNHVYEIDLSADNASRLRDKLARFVEAATHIKPQQGPKVTKKRISTPNSKEQVRAVRNWARQNGFEVSERGRIPKNVLDAFNEAH